MSVYRTTGYEIDTKMLDTEDGKRLEIFDLGSRVLVIFICSESKR